MASIQTCTQTDETKLWKLMLPIMPDRLKSAKGRPIFYRYGDHSPRSQLTLRRSEAMTLTSRGTIAVMMATMSIHNHISGLGMTLTLSGTWLALLFTKWTTV